MGPPVRLNAAENPAKLVTIHEAVADGATIALVGAYNELVAVAPGIPPVRSLAGSLRLPTPTELLHGPTQRQPIALGSLESRAETTATSPASI